MTENKEIMARNIKYYMNKNAVNAAELCKTLGIKQNTFSDWVNAKNYPRIDKIEKMASYFGVNKAFLVEDMTEIDYFSEREKAMIHLYRKSDKDTQKMVDRLLEYVKNVDDYKRKK